MVSSRVRTALNWLTGQLPLLVAGAFIVMALGLAAAATTATAQNLAVLPVADQVVGSGVAQPPSQVIYPQPPVWQGYGRPGMGEIAATGTLEIKNGQLVLSSSRGDIILTAPDGKALGVVTAVGPWSAGGGQLAITVRELIPYPAYQPLPMNGAQGSTTP